MDSFLGKVKGAAQGALQDLQEAVQTPPRAGASVPREPAAGAAPSPSKLSLETATREELIGAIRTVHEQRSQIIAKLKQVSGTQEKTKKVLEHFGYNADDIRALTVALKQAQDERASKTEELESAKHLSEELKNVIAEIRTESAQELEKVKAMHAAELQVAQAQVSARALPPAKERSPIADDEQRASEDARERMASELEQSKAEIERLKNREQELIAEVRQLEEKEAQASPSEEAELELNRVRAVNERLVNEAKGAKEENEKLFAFKAQATTAIETLQGHKQALAAKVRQLLDEKQDLSAAAASADELQSLKVQLSDAVAKEKELAEQLSTTIAERDSFAARCTQATSEKEAAETGQLQQAAQLAASSTALESAKQEALDLKTQFESAVEAKARLEEALEEARGQAETLAAENTEKDAAATSDELEELRNRAEAAEARAQQLQIQLEEEQTEADDARKELASLEADLEHESAGRQAVELHLETAVSERSDAQKALDEAVAQLAEMKERSSDLQQQLEAAQGDREAAVTAMESAQAAADSAEDRVRSELQQAQENSVNDHQEEVQRLQEAVASAERRIEELASELKESIASASVASEGTAQLNATLARKEEKLQALQQRLNEAEARLAEVHAAGEEDNEKELKTLRDALAAKEDSEAAALAELREQLQGAANAAKEAREEAERTASASADAVANCAAMEAELEGKDAMLAEKSAALEVKEQELQEALNIAKDAEASLVELRAVKVTPNAEEEESHQRELTSLQERLAEAESLSADLRGEVEELKADLKKAANETEEEQELLAKERVAAQKTIAQLEENLAAASSQHSGIEEAMKALREEAERQAEAAAQATEACEEQKQAVVALQKELALVRAAEQRESEREEGEELAGLRSQVEASKQILQAALAARQQAEAAASAAEARCNEATLAAEEARKQAAEEQQQRLAAARRAEEVEKLLQEAKAASPAPGASCSETADLASAESLATLRAELSSAMLSKEQLEKEVTEAKEQVQLFQAMQVKRDEEWIKKKNVLKDTAEKLNRQRTTLTKAIEDLDNRTKALEASERQVAIMEQELEGKRSESVELDRLKRMLEEREITEQERLKEKEEEIASLNVKFSKQKNLFASMKIQKDQATQRLSELEGKVEANQQSTQRLLQERIDAARAETRAEFEARLEDQVREIARLKEQLANVREEHRSYKVRAQTALRQKSVESGQHEQYEEHISVLNGEKDQLQKVVKELTDYNQQLRGFEAQYDAMAKEVMLLQEEKATLQSKLSSLREQLREDRSWKEDYEKLQKEKEKMADTAMHEMEKTQEEHTAAYQALSEEFKQYRERLQLQLAERDAEAEKAKSNISDLKSAIAALKQSQVQAQVQGAREQRQRQEQAKQALHSLPTSASVPIHASRHNAQEEKRKAGLLHFSQVQAVRDEDLAEARLAIADLQQQVAESENMSKLHLLQTKALKEDIRELERAQKREGANLEYLKNIVVKYMEGGDHEKLYPVISTILQFKPEERHRVEQAHSKGFWGAILSPKRG